MVGTSCMPFAIFEPRLLSSAFELVVTQIRVADCVHYQFHLLQEESKGSPFDLDLHHRYLHEENHIKLEYDAL